MNVLIITSIVVTVTLAIGTGLATIFVRLSNMVVEEQNTAEKEKTSYNPALTKGHKVAVEADFETQLKEARLLAAKKAAVTPRGANMRIGQLGEKSQPTAFDGIDNDPITTVRVAHFHGWNILRTGAAAGAAAAGAVQTTAAAPVQTKRPEDLVPGKDYEFIQITDSMDPAEIRRARIANAKAKSAAVKALKASGATIAAGPAAVGAPAAAPAAQQQAAAQPQAVAVGGAEPVAGVDYEVIEITDDMDPAAVRKARISNSKAKAAAFKAFKESGGTVGAAAPAPVAQPAAAAPAVQPAAAAVPSSVPRPDFIEITDDMDPADVRKARINNAKAKSAYVKALKDAGIDPATVDMP
jgi:putative ubiquitin-RnfH superfamily antitoxin RatB of RatAB toxin-antitoxin module